MTDHPSPSVEWHTEYDKFQLSIDSDGDVVVYREPIGHGSAGEFDTTIYVPKAKLEELFGFRKREADAVRKAHDDLIARVTSSPNWRSVFLSLSDYADALESGEHE